MLKSDYPRLVCAVGSPEWTEEAMRVLSSTFELFHPNSPCSTPPELYLVESEDQKVLINRVFERLGPAPIKICSRHDLSVIHRAQKNPAHYLNLTRVQGGYSVFTNRQNPINHPIVDRVLGTSKAIQELKTKILRYAPSDRPVLILGESGVGKDLVAQVLHQLSSFSKGPYHSVNCASIPTNLAETELMGCVRGAFTGAVDKKGLLEVVNQGTLFLDEIGDLELSVQTKLLRCLETGEYRRVGSHQVQHSKFRLIAATNKNLEELIEQKLFREDFFFRINTLTLKIPPLRQRKEDIEALLKQLYPDLKFSLGAWSFLLNHPWRGNVRELKSMVEKAKIEAEGGVIDRHHFLN